MNFRDRLLMDLDAVFLNTAGFGEEHLVNGEPVVVQMENMDSPLAGQMADGMANSATLGLVGTVRILRLAESSLLAQPVPGQRLDLDGEWWTVEKAASHMGMLELTLLQSYS